MAATNQYASAHYDGNDKNHTHLNENNFLERNDARPDNITNSPTNSPTHSPTHNITESASDHTVPDRQQNFRKLQNDVAIRDGRLTRRRLPLGVPALDSALAGGLALGRVHMLCASGPTGPHGAYGAVTGFAICLLRHLMGRPSQATSQNVSQNVSQDVSQDGPIVWCPASSLAGSGMLYGAGLAALGLDPGRLLIVDAPSPNRRLEVLEDILRTEGLTAVVAEYDHLGKSSDYWMRLARRAQLAAEASGTTGFLLGCPVAASGFETVWNIMPTIQEPPTQNCVAQDWAAQDRAAQNYAAQPWHPAWAVDLAHVRGGRPYQGRLAWNMHSNRLTSLASPAQLDMQMGAPVDSCADGAVIPKPDHGMSQDMSHYVSQNVSQDMSQGASPDVVMPRYGVADNGHRLAG